MQTRILSALDVQDISSLPYSISMWLSRTHDPAFKWAMAGMDHEQVSVLMTESELHTSSMHRTFPAAVALGRCVSTGRNACLNMDKTCRQERLYWDHFVQSVGLMVAGTYLETDKDASNLDSCVSAFAKKDQKCLSGLVSGVLDVARSVLEVEGSRDKNLAAPSRPVRCNADVFQKLKAVRDRSDHFSSSHWGLKEVPSCAKCGKN